VDEYGTRTNAETKRRSRKGPPFCFKNRNEARHNVIHPCPFSIENEHLDRSAFGIKKHASTTRRNRFYSAQPAKWFLRHAFFIHSCQSGRYNMSSLKKSIQNIPLSIWLAMGISALVLSLFIGKKDFWFDEQYTYFCTSLDWSGLFASIWRAEMNMSLYYILVKIWRYIGESDVSIRMLSLIFAVATVPILYSLGKEMFEKKVGVIAAWLFAVHPFVYDRAQEARGYTLAVLLVSLSTYFFIKILKNQNISNVLLYGISIGLAVYAHFFSLFIIFFHIIYILFIHKKKLVFSTIAAFILSTSLVMTPFLLFIHKGPPNMLHWVNAMNIFSPIGLFFRLSGGFTKKILLEYIIFLFFIFIFIYMFLYMTNIFKNKSQKFEKKYLFLYLWILIPIVFVTIIDYLFMHMFVMRYFFVILPAFIILISAGIVIIFENSYIQKCVVILLVASFITMSLASHLVSPERKKSSILWSQRIAYIDKKKEKNDAVLFLAQRDIIDFYYYMTKNSSNHSFQFAYSGFKFDSPYQKPPQSKDLDIVSEKYGVLWFFPRNKSLKYKKSNDMTLKFLKSKYRKMIYLKNIDTYYFSKRHENSYPRS
jgi:hypothetical protein